MSFSKLYRTTTYAIKPLSSYSSTLFFGRNINKQCQFIKSSFIRVVSTTAGGVDDPKNPKIVFSEKVKDNIMTIPNALCILRIGLTPIVGYLVIQNQFMAACALFTFAGMTDLLDGFIARRYESQRSLLGTMLDPVADKLLVSTLFITLTYVSLIPIALTSIVLLRDVLLVGGGFYRRYQILEPPLTFNRFFDPSVSSVRVVPTLTSKINTALQLSLVTFSLASPVFGFVEHPALTALGIVTAGTTVISGLQYIGGNAMVKVPKSEAKNDESKKE